jgi:hypothetical protein
MEPLVEKRDDGQDRAGLDDDVEQIRLPRNEMLGNEEMPGGGDGEKFRESFDNPEDNGDK